MVTRIALKAAELAIASVMVGIAYAAAELLIMPLAARIARD